MPSTLMFNRLKHAVPATDWLLNYQRRDLQGDLSAGLTVAVMLIPQAMAYAMLAGLPPVIGLYASILPLLIYALMGTSRQLAVGPVAMVALLVTSGVGSIAEAGTAQYVALAILLTLMVGTIQFAMGVFRLGFLTNFMSHPVISGFTSAAALIIGFSQLKHIVGLDLPRTENIAAIIGMTLQSVTDIHLITLAIGLGGIALLIGLRRINPMLPGALIVVVISSLLTWGLGLHQLGVSIVGEVPAGLPAFSVPQFSASQLLELLPIALTISFVGFMESIAVAKKIAAEKRYEVDANQELVALGTANLVGAFFKAMPVTGGFSRTAVNNTAGARTGLASVITALVIALALLFFTPLFYYLPKAVLGSVIMVAVFGLVDSHEVKHLWQVKREDLALLAITFFATLAIGVKEGIFSGIAVSLVWFVVKSTRPHYAIMGRLPGRDDYRNIERFEVEMPQGSLVLRFDAPFYYGNVSFLKQILRKEESRVSGPLRAVILDASAINSLDSSADTALHELLRDYRNRDVALYLAHVKGPVLDVMKRSGFYQRLGAEHFFWNTHDAVLAAEGRAVATLADSPQQTAEPAPERTVEQSLN